jgi:endonuclease/exonuclease/phosphatase family metal-dependent hydrolase
VAKRIVRFLVALLTLFAFYLSVSALFNPLTEGRYLFLAISDQLLPFALIICFLLILFWLSQKSVWVFLPILSIIANIGYLSSVLQIPDKNIKKQPIGINTLCLCTYNVQGFQYGQTDLTVGLIATFMKDRKVDILCLQEIDEETVIMATNLIENHDILPYHTIVPGEQPGFGLAVFSNYPICRSVHIRFGKEGNHAMWSDIVFNKDTIRIFNFHLQTTNFNQSKFPIKGENWLWDMTGETKKTQSMIGTLLLNAQKRNLQAASIKAIIDASPYPVLVCGDLNANPASKAYQLMKSGLTDGFRSAGSGYEYTYRYLFNLYRIDYIFHSANFSGLSYHSYNLDYSDHKPVLMELNLKPTAPDVRE